MRSLRAFMIGSALLFGAAPSCIAQCLPSSVPPEFAQPCNQRYPRWTGELASLGVNSLLGGLSGGVLQELRGKSFRDGFARGAVGGSVIYVGKRIVVGRYQFAGLLGRQVGAVGESVVRNAGAGVPSLSELVFPIGVGRVYFKPTSHTFRFVPDGFAIGHTVAAIQEKGLRFDLRKSLSAGTPLFYADNKILIVSRDSQEVSGVTAAGVILLANVPAFGARVEQVTRKHELVHMIQQDQLFLTITDPFEDWAVQSLAKQIGTPAAGAFVVKHADINLSSSLLSLLAGEIPVFLNRPWET